MAEILDPAAKFSPEAWISNVYSAVVVVSVCCRSVLFCNVNAPAELIATALPSGPPSEPADRSLPMVKVELSRVTPPEVVVMVPVEVNVELVNVVAVLVASEKVNAPPVRLIEPVEASSLKSVTKFVVPVAAILLEELTAMLPVPSC